MASLVHQRCFHHARREAVARCPECHRFFCRECITEHEARVICASCLTKRVTRAASGRGRWGELLSVAGCGLAVFVLWIFFYQWGQMLLSLPSSFHEGTVWREAVEGIE